MTIRKLFNWWISKKRDGCFLFLAVLAALTYLSGFLMTAAAEDALSMTNPGQLSSVLMISGFIGGLLTALGVLIHRNLHAHSRFLDLHKDTDRIPIWQISHVNSFCMTVFLLAALAAMILLPLLTDPLWKAILSWFADMPEVPMPEQPPVQLRQPGAPSPDLASVLGESSPPPAWMKVLGKCMEIFVLLCTAAGCLLLLRSALCSAWSYITRPRHFDDDEKIYLKPAFSLSSSKNDQTKEPARGIRGLFAAPSYTVRIRRLYRKRIREGFRKNRQPWAPPAWASPAEIEKASGLSDQMLHEIYEKARYSKEGCSAEDYAVLVSKVHTPT